MTIWQSLHFFFFFSLESSRCQHPWDVVNLSLLSGHIEMLKWTSQKKKKRCLQKAEPCTCSLLRSCVLFWEDIDYRAAYADLSMVIQLWLVLNIVLCELIGIIVQDTHKCIDINEKKKSTETNCQGNLIQKILLLFIWGLETESIATCCYPGKPYLLPNCADKIRNNIQKRCTGTLHRNLVSEDFDLR